MPCAFSDGGTGKRRKGAVAVVWRRLTGCVLTVVAACSAPGVQQTEVAPAASDFIVGEVYVVTTPLKAVTWGERTSLVPEMRLSEQAAKPVKIEDISPGTHIHIIAIREHNTLTHGMETWPEGIIRNGPLKGTRVALGHPGLTGHMQRGER